MSVVSTFFVSLILGGKAEKLCNRIQSEITKMMDKSALGWNLVDLWLFGETGRAVFFLQKYDLNILSVLLS